MELVEAIKNRKQIETIKKILRSNRHGLRDVALFTLGLNSGLRVSDLLALRVGNVRDQRGRVLDRIELREAKTGKPKRFPVGATAAKALSEYLDHRKPGSHDEWLFPSQKGGPLQRVQAHTILSEAARAAGITGRIGTHSLRKTFGYWVYKQTGDLALVQRLLNHRSQADTLRYIGLQQEELDAAYLAVNL